MDQGEPGLDYNDPNLNPLECDLCKQKFDSLVKLGEHQKVAHDMWNRVLVGNGIIIATIMKTFVFFYILIFCAL